MQGERRDNQLTTRELSRDLHRIGAIRFGEFTLKDGRTSPFYLDLRVLVSHPVSLARVGRALARAAEPLTYDRIAGIPYAGLPIAVAMSLVNQRPLIYPRREAKSYGTRRLIEGEYGEGESALVIDDVITSGGAKVEAVEQLRGAGLRVSDVLVVVDRSAPGSDPLASSSVSLHSVLRIEPLLENLCSDGLIDRRSCEHGLAFVAGEQ